MAEQQQMANHQSLPRLRPRAHAAENPRSPSCKSGPADRRGRPGLRSDLRPRMCRAPRASIPGLRAPLPRAPRRSGGGRDGLLAFMRRYISIQVKTLGRVDEAQTRCSRGRRSSSRRCSGQRGAGTGERPAACQIIIRSLTIHQVADHRGWSIGAFSFAMAARDRPCSLRSNRSIGRTRRFCDIEICSFQIDSSKINDLARLGPWGKSIQLSTLPPRSKIRLMNRRTSRRVLVAKRPDSDVDG